MFKIIFLYSWTSPAPKFLIGFLAPQGVKVAILTAFFQVTLVLNKNVIYKVILATAAGSKALAVQWTHLIICVSLGCQLGVTLGSIGCHLGVTWVSVGCHLGVTWVSLGCQLVVTWVSIGWHLSVTLVSIGYPCGSLGRHLDVTWESLGFHLDDYF